MSTKVTVLGSVPDSDSAAVGEATVMTVKVPAVPTVKVVAAAEVKVGAAFTVRVKSWVAFEPTPLLAVIDQEVGTRCPGGRCPGQGGGAVTVVDEGHAGGQGARLRQRRSRCAVVVTVKVPLWPSVKVVALPEVMAGAESTVRVKCWVAFGAHAVAGRDHQVVGAGRSRRRGPGQGGRAVTVVDEGDGARQGAGFGERRGRGARWWSR